jgi:hypothetical protein
VRIPSWLGAVGPLHSEAVYIGADRFRYQTVFACNQATDHTYTPARHRTCDTFASRKDCIFGIVTRDAQSLRACLKLSKPSQQQMCEGDMDHGFR